MVEHSSQILSSEEKATTFTVSTTVVYKDDLKQVYLTRFKQITHIVRGQPGCKENKRLSRRLVRSRISVVRFNSRLSGTSLQLCVSLFLLHLTRSLSPSPSVSLSLPPCPLSLCRLKLCVGLCVSSVRKRERQCVSVCVLQGTELSLFLSLSHTHTRSVFCRDRSCLQ